MSTQVPGVSKFGETAPRLPKATGRGPQAVDERNLIVLEPSPDDEHARNVASIWQHGFGNLDGEQIKRVGLQAKAIEKQTPEPEEEAFDWKARLPWHQRARIFFTGITEEEKKIRDRALAEHLDQTLKADVLSRPTRFIGKTADSLERILEQEKPLPKVVNGSIGWNRMQMYQKTEEFFIEHQQQLRSAETRKALFGEDEFSYIPGQNLRENTQFRQAVVNYVDRHIENDPEFNQELQRFEQAARQLREQNTQVVIAAGNEHEEYVEWRSQGVNIRPGADFNFLAQNNEVISVAAAHDAGTPDDPTDDQVAKFSSRGDGRYRPFITAVGQNVKTPDFQTGINGTSFAVPKVSATITRMLEVNPNLTSDDIRRILKEWSIDTDAPDNAEGAGMLDKDLAVAIARHEYEAAQENMTPTQKK